MRKQISSGSSFEKNAAYSRAIIDGNWAFLSGVTGYDYSKMIISTDILEQTEQCFINIGNVLKEAGFEMQDIMRVTYILPNRDEFEKCWPILRKYFGDIKPAATMFEAKLANDDIKIEIEVTALKRER
jgi:enamine deaminase RidA (YjgF/YER057c/UK114 family)